MISVTRKITPKGMEVLFDSLNQAVLLTYPIVTSDEPVRLIIRNPGVDETTHTEYPARIFPASF